MEHVKKFLILPEERLVLEYLGGHGTWADYLELKKEEIANPLYDGTFDVITDIRDVDAEFNLQMEKEVKNYVLFLSNQKIELTHRTAVLTNTPKQLLHAEFFKMSGNKLPISMKTVSTYESAFLYIKLDESKHQKVIKFFEEIKPE